MVLYIRMKTLNFSLNFKFDSADGAMKVMKTLQPQRTNTYLSDSWFCDDDNVAVQFLFSDSFSALESIATTSTSRWQKLPRTLRNVGFFNVRPTECGMCEVGWRFREVENSAPNLAMTKITSHNGFSDVL